MSVQYTGGGHYTGGISMSTLRCAQYTGGYHEYTGGVQYSGDIMSTPGVFIAEGRIS